MDVVSDIVHLIIDVIYRILDIRIIDIPLIIAYVGVIAMIGYIASLIIIGFPCTIIEAITKKKIPDEIQNKIIRIVAICLDVILAIMLLMEK